MSERAASYAALHDELAGYSGGGGGHSVDLEAGEIAVPLRIRADGAELAFISTATEPRKILVGVRSMPSTGWFRRMLPVEPWNRASPKVKIPPS